MSNITPLQNLNAYITKSDKMLQRQLGEKASEFTANLLSIAESSADLQECEPQKLINCAMNATALDLPLNKNLGYAYIIPYKKNKKVGTQWVQTVEPQFQIGAKGFKQLAMRSGEYKNIIYTPVRKGELKYNKFNGEFDFLGDFPENEIVGYLASFTLLNSFQSSLYMTVEQMTEHADKYSSAFDKQKNEDLKNGEIPKNEMYKYSSPWYEDFDKMALKTVTKLLLSRDGILSIKLQKAVEVDQAGHNGDYIDNKKNAVIIEEEPEQIKAPEQEKKEVDPFENPEIAIVEEENTLDFF